MRWPGHSDGALRRASNASLDVLLYNQRYRVQTGHGTLPILPLTRWLLSERRQSCGFKLIQKKGALGWRGPPFFNLRWPSSLFFKRPCTICSCCGALGQQLFHIIFRKSNKRVLPVGLTNWMVLFQIKKTKTNLNCERSPNYPLVSKKTQKSLIGSLLGHLQKPSNCQLRQGLGLQLLVAP